MFDTADGYSSGRSEEVLGGAIHGRRADVIIATKAFFPMGSGHNNGGASRYHLIQACEASLKRLGTDHLDCYLLHWPGSHPLGETIGAFEELVRAGKIRSWGLSNFDVDDLEEALEIAGPRRIACNQVLYHLRARDIEHLVLPWCVEHEVAAVGYSPFGSGDFPQPQSRGGKVLGEIARAHGMTPHQVAVAFLIRDPHLFAIPKSARVARVRENAAAAELRLTPEEVARIEDAFPLRRGRHLPTL
jgi:aryl-alcohol dehydrogenase-like predicted oxidoreductase